MKRLALLALLCPSAALAHPGGHHEFSGAGSIAHALSEPDHLLAIAALAAVVTLGGILWRRARVKQGQRK